MSADRAFFDTNVLLYLYGDDGVKRPVAKELFGRCVASGSVLISTQVIQEFYVAGSRKLRMVRRELEAAIGLLLDLPLVTIGGPQIVSAMGLEERYGISFWDSLIIAAAAAGGARVLYTEHLNDGQQYGTVVVRNPFRI